MRALLLLVLVCGVPAWLMSQVQIIVQVPNGGEYWIAGERQYIRFDAYGTAYVKIELTTDGGGNWLVLSPLYVAGDDLMGIDVPNTPSTLCKVRISSGSVADESDSLFTIRPAAYQPPWSKVDSHTASTLYGMYFFKSGEGWVCGDLGTMLHTVNGGNSWNVQISPTKDLLLDMCFADHLKGFAVGGGGSLIRTTDGGNTWLSGNSTVTQPLYAVAFINSATGFIVGGAGTLLRTTDGGVTWTSLSSGSTLPLQSIAFADSAVGLIVGGDGPYGGGNVVIKTTDGGSTWTTSRPSIDQAALTSVIFLDRNTALMSGGYSYSFGANYYIYRTSDAGGHWNQVLSSRGSGITFIMHKLACLDSLTAFVVGYPLGVDEGFVLRSTNGGMGWDWSTARYFRGATNAISFVDKNRGIIAGSNGSIYVTSSGGLTPVHWDAPSNIARGYALFQNYPNPFNPTSRIRFNLGGTAHVLIRVFDVLGRQVRVLEDEELAPGPHEVTFEASGLSSGVYFYEINAGPYSESKKMVLVR